MSSIIREGDTFHGISVESCGMFTNDEHGETYAGQHRDGYACGLGVVTWSRGHKEYAEHGPDGQCDGRWLYRDADGDTCHCVFERGDWKASAYVDANGSCTYNFEVCAPDDVRVLALIAQVAPVEVRPATPDPTRHSPPSHRPMDRPARVCRRRRWRPPWPPRCTPTPHAVAAARATQPNSSKARPRSGACAGRVDVGGARVGALMHPNNRPSGAHEASLTQLRCHAIVKHAPTRGGLHISVHTKYCTMCKTPGHRQKFGSCPFRECSECKQVGHSARECRKQSYRTSGSDVDGRNTMDDANDEDADTSTMSVDGQSDDRNHMSERGDGDRLQEYDRSNLSDASERKHDDDEDIEDTRTRGASITIDLGYESDDGKRTLEPGDLSSLLAMETMMARMMTRTGKATRSS
jgi:hypothetical protein